jgi:hypothetical protein
MGKGTYSTESSGDCETVTRGDFGQHAKGGVPDETSRGGRERFGLDRPAAYDKVCRYAHQNPAIVRVSIFFSYI